MKILQGHKVKVAFSGLLVWTLLNSGCASDSKEPKALEPESMSMSARSIGVVEKKTANPTNILMIQECPDSDTYFNSALESNTLTVGLSWQVSMTQRKMEKARVSTTYRCTPR